MKFIPILFSTPMVQAINEGRKTMTRRVVKPQPPNDFEYLGTDTDRASGEPIFYACWEGDTFHNVKSPYGQIGDVLWVKETHFAFGEWKKNGTTKTGKQKWKFVRQRNIPVRFIDNKPEAVESPKFRGLGWYKRSSLFLEKKDCRIFLQNTNVKVEQLEDISYNDAIAEGINYVIDKVTGFCGYDYFGGGYNVMTTPVISFFSLWRKVQGLNKYDKTGNPYVWVIEFKRIDKPENFN